MPYQISWHVEKRVLMVKLFGVLIEQESNEVGEINTRYLQEGIAPVHIIVDTNGLEKFPVNLRQNSQFMAYLSSPALGWVVVLGLSNNMLARFAVTVISQVVKFKLAQRTTVDDALSYLQSQDSTLKSNQASAEQVA
jgi:hypothetical protein